MRNTHFIAAFVGTLAFSDAAVAQAADSADVATIRRLQWEWMQAWKNRDRATLERILAPEYRLLVSADPGRPGSREGWLRSALGPYVADSVSYQTMDITILGDVAVVASLFHQKATIFGFDRSGPFFLTDVWQRRGGQWQVVRRYSAKPEVVSERERAIIDSLRRRPPQ
jgi:ketosteroid isomerase-like protein